MEHKLFIFLSSSANLGQAQVCSLRQIPLKLRQLGTSSAFHQTAPSSLDFKIFFLMKLTDSFAHFIFLGITMITTIWDNNLWKDFR